VKAHLERSLRRPTAGASRPDGDGQ
jgi:hypothetical protein